MCLCIILSSVSLRALWSEMGRLLLTSDGSIFLHIAHTCAIFHWDGTFPELREKLNKLQRGAISSTESSFRTTFLTWSGPVALSVFRRRSASITSVGLIVMFWILGSYEFMHTLGRCLCESLRVVWAWKKCFYEFAFSKFVS